MNEVRIDTDILTGKEAKTYLERALKIGDEQENKGIEQDWGEGVLPPKAGHYDENGIIIAFDNRDWCCWVEQFETVEIALQWINGEIEATGNTFYPDLSKSSVSEPA